MDPDDAAYRRSVRNVSIILALIVAVLGAALFLPGLLSPTTPAFSTSSEMVSNYGFVLGLRLNATSLGPTGHLGITAVINNTSSQILNVSAADSWTLDRNGLWGRVCTSGWPMGIGVMQGFYTNENYTHGTLVPIPRPLTSCPENAAQPTYFLIETQGTQAIADVNGTLEQWDLRSMLSFGSVSSTGINRPGGVYTVVAADEWGDATFLYFTPNYLP